MYDIFKETLIPEYSESGEFVCYRTKGQVRVGLASSKERAEEMIEALSSTVRKLPLPDGEMVVFYSKKQKKALQEERVLCKRNTLV